MKHEPKAHINERLHTTLANSGRAAGAGILYDHYDEESGTQFYTHGGGRVRFPSDGLTQDELKALSGPVRIIRPARKEQ